MRTSRFVSVVAFAFVLVVAGLGCVADDPHPDAAPATASTGAGPTTSAVTAVDDVPTLGQTDVQVASRLPLFPMEWRTVELDNDVAGAWLMSLVEVDGQFVATAMAWQEGDGQTVVQWRSDDTVSWKRSETVLVDGWMNQVEAVGDRLVGIGSSADPVGPGAPRLWIDEGSGWEIRDLGLPAEPGSSTYIFAVAGNDDGVALAGDRQPYEPIPPTILSSQGFQIEIDDNTGTYVATEVASGRVITSGPTSEIYRWSETGQALYDPATGDVLIEVPWERWEDLYPGSTPLPIAVPADPQAQPPTIEFEGFRITVDEANGVFEIVRLASGEVISGRVEDLYRGPGPRFVDSTTGQAVLTFSWSEWDALLSRAWDGRIEVHEPHETETVVLFSQDLITWDTQTINLGQNAHLEALTVVDGNFVITVLEHFEGGSDRLAWVSEDGRSWESVGAVGPESLGHVVSRPDSLAALAWGSGNPTVVSSDDGLHWRQELAIDTQSDGRDAWFDLISTGPLGTLVSGTIYPEYTDVSLAIEVGGRTARFGPHWAVEITEDATGEVILALTWEQIDNPDGDPPVTYADQATRFWNPDGQLVMEIPDEVVYATYEAQSAAVDQQVSKVLFLKTPDGAWFEMTPPAADRRTSEHLLAVGEQAVIIGRMTWGDGSSEESEPDSIQLLIGTPTD